MSKPPTCQKPGPLHFVVVRKETRKASEKHGLAGADWWVSLEAPFWHQALGVAISKSKPPVALVWRASGLAAVHNGAFPSTGNAGGVPADAGRDPSRIRDGTERVMTRGKAPPLSCYSRGRQLISQTPRRRVTDYLAMVCAASRHSPPDWAHSGCGPTTSPGTAGRDTASIPPASRNGTITIAPRFTP